jgi:hypothetical protein
MADAQTVGILVGVKRCLLSIRILTKLAQPADCE